MSNKVHILPGPFYNACEDVFKNRGYVIVDTPEDSDIIVYQGGTDINPKLYNQEPHPLTQSPDDRRDKFEIETFQNNKGKFHLGICRGGQLLNVLNGGTLIQHVGPFHGLYEMMIVKSEEIIEVECCHHQGMVTADSGSKLLGFQLEEELDYVLYYPKTRSLCIQYHPEWGHSPSEQSMFTFLKELY